jgi:CRISPR-associated protein Cas1
MESPGEREESSRTALPDYLPARMLNEFVYCPRLFFYEWVDGIFQESADTVEGKFQHRRVDEKATELPAPEDLGDDTTRSRSVTLSSERHGVIARMDLVEAAGGLVTPIDYKHGDPRETEQGIELWPADRMQLAVQGLVLRDNGYRCEEGLVYYFKTKQRVRVAFDEGLVAETARVIAEARSVAGAAKIPPPLEDSPKCQGCSLVGICLPDETIGLSPPERSEDASQLLLFDDDRRAAGNKAPAPAVRRLIAPRDDLRPAYLNTQGMRVGKSGEVLQVREKDALKQEIRIGEISQLNLMGNIQVSTQAIQSLCFANVPICYFSQGGWFYGITTGMNVKNVFLRKAQYRLVEEDWFVLALARRLVEGKIRNHRTMLQRNHIEPRAVTLHQLKTMAERAEQAQNIEELLGIEGNAARLYFGDFAGMIKTEDDADVPKQFQFDFSHRNRRPPRDAVNAMMSFAYSLLAKDCTIACYAVGFDPMMGFYHQPRFGRPALALDLMEPFRPLIGESVVLSAINNRMVRTKDFVAAGPAISLTADGRKGLLQAYELRMDSMVTHPIFDYRVSYRRLLEIQARLLARFLQNEIGTYPVFVTR